MHDHNEDGIDRRGFLECMAWAGTGVLWSVGSGMLSSQAFGQNKKNAMKGGLHFVQISDSHMGFNKAANPDVASTMQATIDKIIQSMKDDGTLDKLSAKYLAAAWGADPSAVPYFKP